MSLVAFCRNIKFHAFCEWTFVFSSCIKSLDSYARNHLLILLQSCAFSFFDPFNDYIDNIFYAATQPKKVVTLFNIQVGFSHSNILRTIIYRACMRFSNLTSFSRGSGHLPRRLKSSHISEVFSNSERTRKVFVIFGGATSERQVSLMSGTNVWLNLQDFDDVSIIQQVVGV